ncbi:adenosylhomocysteinase [Microbacterium sp.]|uniref:adenosylhomocysteinase n=1 Tax=Microbacterium sp. TaxID=51671 RepID=UPI00261634E6|nr:adenosylhomocysteinase [Microbacterium sp.]MCV0334864.1 adenosylhomocysteinase [Microbacterium sp.]MCV0373957.1 adenosylhomocysteinase [Microbacterium sp.]MCV0391168.1 adenosylhomocysteinase [Microbacterium sp.]MCV0418563.1 adenosylhomocysteinase [Microbacterium sp.]MCV0423008.1 adenosylhomocysteinase [Microbacterium sp.]
MTDETATAQRLVRRFARETNLLVAGRDFSVVGTDAVADELRRLLPALGAHLGDAGVVFAPGETPEILLDGHALPVRETAEDRVDAAGRHMPVATALATRLREAGTVRGLRIGIAMVLEPKTAQLALLLRDAGAAVAVYAHPDEIDVEVAQVLRARGIPVDGDPSLSGAAERAAAVSFLRRGFDLMLDDGSHLIRLAHEEGLARELRGAAEETTSGLTPLRLMEREGLLEIPVIAVNDALTKTSFDNRYGTGQSCVFAIADALDAAGIDLRDQPAVVVGYGPVGEGVAAHLRALGVQVGVAETDPVRALRAAHDGYRIGRLHDLAPGALVVSATGAPHTVDAVVLRAAAIVAVAGGVPHEVDLDPATLRPFAGESGASSPFVERAGEGALVIARGGCVNLSAGEGNPIEIMDLSFSVQLFAVEHLLAHGLPAGVHALPHETDTVIGAAALALRGAPIDQCSPAQVEAQREWRSPRFRGGSA